eukprot:TRINITY_DN2061_c0_g2_i1.p1 TRINITY_DN2061_c0_g2~~TRINITY_DN2061_c0_g2_i1.p1  ORF type:complete len:306 (-),score=27.65 TRINITY_DN2061_c0_g2_i1:893-1810(-)
MKLQSSIFICLLMLPSSIQNNIEFLEVTSEMKLISPTRDALGEFFKDAEEIFLEYDLDEIFRNRTTTFELASQIRDLLRSSESTYPFVIHIPNKVMVPFIKSQANAGAQEGLQRIREVDEQFNVTDYQLDVHVPKNGSCKNTYRADIMVQAQRFFCVDLGFFGSTCTTPILTLSGYSCVSIEADGWVLNLNVIDLDTAIDGSNLLGKIIAGILKFFQLDELMRRKIQSSFDSVDFGNVVNTDIIGKAFSIIDSLAPVIQEARDTTDEEFQQYIDDIKTAYSIEFRKLVNITAEIDPYNLIFTARF